MVHNQATNRGGNSFMANWLRGYFINRFATTPFLEVGMTLRFWLVKPVTNFELRQMTSLHNHFSQATNIDAALVKLKIKVTKRWIASASLLISLAIFALALLAGRRV
jgi:hypothetical protein